MPVGLRAGGVLSADAAIDEGNGPFVGLFSAYADAFCPRAAIGGREGGVWPNTRVAIKNRVILFSNPTTDPFMMDA